MEELPVRPLPWLAALGISISVMACASEETAPPASSTGGAASEEGGGGAPMGGASTGGAPSTGVDMGGAPVTTANGGATGAGGGIGTASLEIESGDGGVVPSGWPASDPLRVRLRDEEGAPVPGATIAFEVTVGNAVHIQAVNGEATTDASGVAATTYNAFPIDPNLPFEVDTVTARYGDLTANFQVVISQVPANTLPALPLVQLDAPVGAPDLGTAQAGTVVPGGLRAIAVFQQGFAIGEGIPSWGLRLTSTDDLLTPSEVQCAGGTVLADASGHVSCDIVAPATPGDYAFTILAGGAIRFDAGHLHVVP